MAFKFNLTLHHAQIHTSKNYVMAAKQFSHSCPFTKHMLNLLINMQCFKLIPKSLIFFRTFAKKIYGNISNSTAQIAKQWLNYQSAWNYQYHFKWNWISNEWHSSVTLYLELCWCLREWGPKAETIKIHWYYCLPPKIHWWLREF